MTFGKIGARRMMHHWTNPYITDGLVAMWDGEWNAGGGVHDPNATVWKDLSGYGNNATPSTNPLPFDGNSLVYSGQNGRGWVVSEINGPLSDIVATIGDWYTVELALSMSSQSNNAIIFSLLVNQGGEHSGARFAGGILYYSDARRGQQGMWLANHYGFSYSSIDLTIPNVVSKWRYVYSKNGNPTYDYGEKYETVFRPKMKGPLEFGNLSFPTFTGTWNGHLYNLRFYNRRLTADEIAHNYAVDKLRFNLP